LKKSLFIPREKIKEVKLLLSRVITLVIVACLVYLVYLFFSSKKSGSDFELEDSPLKVEQIRSILELNTLKFQDEVVVDTVEYYGSTAELVQGTVEKLMDFDQLKNGLKPSGVKRRLSLVVRGELLYGVNLKTKDFQLIPSSDSVIVKIPQPELLSISVNPDNTKVFIENGFWKDSERRTLQIEAKLKMVASGEALKLAERAKQRIVKLIEKMVRTDRKVIIQFYGE
jgi:hypothetical protein